jgi:hypothetical protein
MISDGYKGVKQLSCPLLSKSQGISQLKLALINLLRRFQANSSLINQLD